MTTLRDRIIDVIVRDAMDRAGMEPLMDTRAVPGNVLGQVVEMRRAAESIADEILDALLGLGKSMTDDPDRTIEDHLLAIAPREGFDIGDITNGDRREIARVILDAYTFGIGWLTRGETGFKREDPLRIEVRDRRVT